MLFVKLSFISLPVLFLLLSSLNDYPSKMYQTSTLLSVLDLVKIWLRPPLFGYFGPHFFGRCTDGQPPSENFDHDKVDDASRIRYSLPSTLNRIGLYWSYANDLKKDDNTNDHVFTVAQIYDLHTPQARGWRGAWSQNSGRNFLLLGKRVSRRFLFFMTFKPSCRAQNAQWASLLGVEQFGWDFSLRLAGPSLR